MIRQKTQVEVVEIPGGSFEMGSTIEEIEFSLAEWSGRLIAPGYRDVFRDWLMKEYPAHRVHVEAFAIARFPVSNGEFRAFLGQHPDVPTPESISSGLPDDHPVWGVSIERAEAYVRWRALCDGLPWRLPDEVEWEWAARGRDARRYPFGNRFSADVCNTLESGRGVSTPVDAFPGGASPWGVLDLAGNVEEWTATNYAPYPGGELIDDELLRELGPNYRILRGGSFALGGDLARTRRRHGPHPGHLFRVTGFRMAFSPHRHAAAGRIEGPTAPAGFRPAQTRPRSRGAGVFSPPVISPLRGGYQAP
jgi:formylglycine-generating enzyme required for sulfatase activity